MAELHFGLRRIEFISSVGSIPAAQAWTIPISFPSEVTQELRLMFWDLKGATARPRFLRILQRAATMVLFPEWEVVRGTTMNRVMSFAAGMSEFICLLE